MDNTTLCIRSAASSINCVSLKLIFSTVWDVGFGF